MKFFSRFAIALPLIILDLAGCGGGFPNGPATSAPTELSVNPSSMTVAAGSTNTFTAVFAPVVPSGGSLTWSVNPASGGTITGAGVFTASATPETYAVVATWTPSSPSSGAIITGRATVEVLAAPQQSSELNPDMIEASGGVQGFAAIQNSAIVGELLASTVSKDPSGNVQTDTGFQIPVACSVSGGGCP